VKTAATILGRIRGVTRNNEAMAILYRLSQAGSLLICFRLVIVHFGVVSYGIVALMLSCIVYLSLLDFGIISVMRSEIPFAYYQRGMAYANGVARLGLIRLALSLTVFCLFLIAIVIVSDSLLLPLMDFLKLTGKISIWTFRSFLLTVVCYCQLLLLTNFTQASLSALLQQYRVFLLLMVGNIVQITAVALGIFWGLNIATVFALMILSSFLPVLPLVAHRLYKICNVFDVTAILPKHTKNTSTSFFVIQVIGALANNIDTLLVAHFTSFGDVAVYATMKLIVQMLLSLQANYVSQAWPQFSALRAQERWNEISALLMDRLGKSVLFAIACALGIVAFSPLFFALWSNNSLTISTILCVAFGVQLVICMISVSFMPLLYSFNYVRVLAFMSPLGLVIMYVISSQFAFMGPVAMVISNIVAQFLGLGVGLYFYFFVYGRLQSDAASAPRLL
jgi:O-antigen/teichoic acid export membrane protein